MMWCQGLAGSRRGAALPGPDAGGGADSAGSLDLTEEQPAGLLRQKQGTFVAVPGSRVPWVCTAPACAWPTSWGTEEVSQLPGQERVKEVPNTSHLHAKVSLSFPPTTQGLCELINIS